MSDRKKRVLWGGTKKKTLSERNYLRGTEKIMQGETKKNHQRGAVRREPRGFCRDEPRRPAREKKNHHQSGTKKVLQRLEAKTSVRSKVRQYLFVQRGLKVQRFVRHQELPGGLCCGLRSWFLRSILHLPDHQTY